MRGCVVEAVEHLRGQRLWGFRRCQVFTPLRRRGTSLGDTGLYRRPFLYRRSARVTGASPSMPRSPCNPE